MIASFDSWCAASYNYCSIALPTNSRILLYLNKRTVSVRHLPLCFLTLHRNRNVVVGTFQRCIHRLHLQILHWQRRQRHRHHPIRLRRVLPRSQSGNRGAVFHVGHRTSACGRRWCGCFIAFASFKGLLARHPTRPRKDKEYEHQLQTRAKTQYSCTQVNRVLRVALLYTNITQRLSDKRVHEANFHSSILNLIQFPDHAPRVSQVQE